MEIISVKLEYHLEKLDNCSNDDEIKYHLAMAKASARVLKSYMNCTSL